MAIKDIQEGQRRIYISAKLEAVNKRHIDSRNEDVMDLILVDDTGKIELTIFKEENLKKITEENPQPDQEFRIESGYCKGEYEGAKKITIGDYGKLTIKKGEIFEPFIDMAEITNREKNAQQ